MGYRRDRMRRRDARPPFEIRTPAVGLEIVLLPSTGERIAALGRPVIDADWISELTDLLSAPDTVKPASMPMVIQQLARLTSWAQATQTEWLARFARPGVAVPVGDVLEAAMASDADMAIDSSHPVQPNDEDLYVERSYTQTSVYGDPAWDIVVARSSARFAAVEIGATLHLSPITARGMVDDAVELVDQLPGRSRPGAMAGSIATGPGSSPTEPPCSTPPPGAQWKIRCSFRKRRIRRFSPPDGCGGRSTGP